jgi:hypothetical protein
MALVLAKDMRRELAETVSGRQKHRNETFFCYHRGEQEMMWGNNDELTEQMKAWRKQRKEGILVMKPFNNKTKYIKGKPWYILVVQDEDIYRGVDNIGIDRLGMGFDTPYLVSGLIYVFKHEKNRDATFNYVMGIKTSSSAHASV